jgi:ribose 1,5-bisphosphokinase
MSAAPGHFKPSSHRSAQHEGAPVSGRWVIVCGPSGAGKDSVIGWAATHLLDRPDIVFARRMVTRLPRPGSDHDAVTPKQFSSLTASGGMAWHWDAHGFRYGIEARYGAEVQSGRVVVVNGSREHALAVAAQPLVRVVQILADPEQLALRLTQRGREAPHDINRRVARNALFSDLRADHTIVNQGTLANAGRQLADYLVGGAAAGSLTEARKWNHNGCKLDGVPDVHNPDVKEYP